MTALADNVLIRQAEWPRDSAAATALLRDYLEFLQNSPVALDELHIESYERELKTLASVWQGTHAALLLAWRNGDPAGCVGIRLLHDPAGAAEMKRLWVRPGVRGAGMGERLVRAAMVWAREHHARELLLDTAPNAMPEAQKLYLRLGFEPCGRYNHNSVPSIVFYRLPLE